MTPNEQLLEAGRVLRVRSIMTGRPHSVLQAEAEAHAAYQAKIQRQGHFWWANRVHMLRQHLPECDSFRECCNESWPRQDTVEAAKEMFRSWKLSPGHWSAINGNCTYYGYAMARGQNSIWYACAVFADVRTA